MGMNVVRQLQGELIAKLGHYKIQLSITVALLI
ncbi:hypothetical protein V1289_009689 [Bradyrhizobium sp. AZCC 2289]